MNPERWQKVKSILENAVEIASSERRKYLDEACDGDDELRCEIESLLAFEINADRDDALEQPAISGFVQDASNIADGKIGETVGNYTILEKLGEGGMGAVFLAERTDGEFNQKVAVKLIKRGINLDVMRRRFYRERQILATLEHPNIARLIDGGTTHDGLPYLVMEYVEGAPITEFCQNENLNLTERLDLFRQVCAAVSYAHHRLVVHRDLKPSNILVSADGTPKLLDFGIAKLLNDERIGETQTQTLAFTPEYASPEQIRGENLTTSTDIYSLGVILYELLTGARPFTFEGKNFGQIVHTATQTEPLRPSSALTKSPRENLPAYNINRKILSGDLDNIILKALKKETERRFSSVEKLSDDIRRYLKGLPVTARQDTIAYRAEKFTRRNPLLVGAVSMAFLILIGGIAAVSWQVRIANLERATAERRFNDVRALANSFMFEINEEISRNPIKARELLVKRALEYLDKMAAEGVVDTELQSEIATAYEKIGGVQSELFNLSLGQSGEAIESHRKSLAIRQKLFAANPENLQLGLDLARSHSLIGDTSTVIGKQSEAVENYRQAIGIYERLLIKYPENYSLERGLSAVYGRFGQAILRSGALSESLRNYNKALEIQKKLAANNPTDLKMQHNVSVISSYIGYVEMEMGNFNQALRFFRDSLAIEEEIWQTDRNNKEFQSALSIAHVWVGVALHESGDVDNSLIHIQKSLEIQQAIYNTDKSNIGEQNILGDCYLELGLALKKAGKLNEAVASYERGIANFEAVAKADTQNLAARRQIAFTRRRLADALFEQNAVEKALQNHEKSLAEFEELTQLDANNTEWRYDAALSHLKVGEILLKKNDSIRARTHFETARPILEALVAQSPENINRQRDLTALKKHLENINK